MRTVDLDEFTKKEYFTDKQWAKITSIDPKGKIGHTKKDRLGVTLERGSTASGSEKDNIGWTTDSLKS